MTDPAKVLRSIKTASLCPTCYREVQAERQYREDGGIWIAKECPDHGYFEGMAEKSAAFWDAILTTNRLKSGTFTHTMYNNISMVEVTDRCNVQCKHCYHSPDNKTTDRPADWIIAKAIGVHTVSVCLMGAEPTMRDDLPEIVREVAKHKRTTIYTNGVRMRDRSYVNRLRDAGLAACSMSVHHPDYHTDKVWGWVTEGLRNVIDSGIQLGQVSFTVESPKQVETAIGAILKLWKIGVRPSDYCIRSPAQIGVPFEQPQEIYASQVFDWVTAECARREIPSKLIREYGSNPYHVGTYVGVANAQVIHWPTALTVDLAYMNMGPWANFIDGTKGSFVIQALQRDGMKKGWWQGRRLMPEGTARYTHYDAKAGNAAA